MSKQDEIVPNKLCLVLEGLFLFQSCCFAISEKSMRVKLEMETIQSVML